MVDLIIHEIDNTNTSKNLVDKGTQTELTFRDINKKGAEFINYYNNLQAKKIYHENEILRKYYLKKDRNSVLFQKNIEKNKLEKTIINEFKNLETPPPSWLLFRSKN